jgi:hypothetical protein
MGATESSPARRRRLAARLVDEEQTWAARSGSVEVRRLPRCLGSDCERFVTDPDEALCSACLTRVRTTRDLPVIER